MVAKVDELYRYSINYPQIRHPLFAEKEKLKLSYMSLLKYYADELYPNNKMILMRLQTFRVALFNSSEISFSGEFELKHMLRSVLKTRFRPFRLFSYRYLFLFDCLVLLAPDDFKKGKRICGELKKFVNTRYHETLDDMVQQMYEGNKSFAHKKMISQEMLKAWRDMQSYIHSRNRNITFTATMSAGKSTLINAIIGKKLSHAKKAACTANVMKFASAPANNSVLNVYCEGEFKTLQAETDVQCMIKTNEKYCEVIGYFSSILSRKKITLIDTPGVNSSRNPSHKKIARSELIGEDTDIVVYIIPVENYGAEDDYEHLTYIKKNVEYKQIVFVVNMLDSCDFEDDSVPEILKDISEHLISIGFENPVICPISAKAGIIIKQALNGIKLSKSDKALCKIYANLFRKEELALKSYYPITECAHFENAEIESLQLQESSEDLYEAYINTGLPGFEKLLYDMTEEDK